MSELDIVNDFLKKETLSDTEKAIKEQLLATDSAIKSNSKEREELTNALKQKEVDFLKLSGSLESQIKLIVDLSKLNTAQVSE